MPPSTVVSSPSTSSRSSDGLPYLRNMSDFEVECMPSKVQLSPSKPRRRGAPPEQNSEAMFRASVSRLVAAKARPFAVAGRIPVDPTSLTLFFRSKSGITHSIDFPIDIDYDMPPALEVLIAACRPHSPSGLEEFSEHESLFYPYNLPLTTTLEISNHPILDAVRNTLFPTLPVGHYLTTMRDRLEIWVTGRGMKVQHRPNDSRVATIVVTLPVRFRGGGLVVRNVDGIEERFYGRGGKSGDMEWTAFMADCDHEIEPVQKGCRVTMSFAVHLRSFGPAGLQPNPLITPSDDFLDLLSPILNMSRGRKIAFHLTGEYGVNPGEVLAESLVPYLKGGDSILYHAVKLYKLSPELRWGAGGYIWAVDQTVDFDNDVDESPTPTPLRTPFAVINGSRMSPPTRTSSSASELGDGGSEDPRHIMRFKVEKSGAVPISEADIFLLSDASFPGPITKERVPFVHGTGLEKLVVNILLVVFVP